MYFKSTFMLRTIIRPLAACGCFWLLLSACSKHTEPVIPRDAGLAFYNASQVLRQQLIGTTGAFSRILLNNEDPKYTNDSANGADGIYMPEFSASGAGTDPQQIFPRLYGYAVTPTWLGYMRVNPGTQHVAFLSPDSSNLVQTSLDTKAGDNTCLYLTDSLGYYHTFSTIDDSHPAPDEVQVKVVHLGPDAGPLTVAVNNNPVDAGRSFVYRSNSNWNSYAAQDTRGSLILKVQVVLTSNPSADTVRTIITATPGHSYTLTINGYYYDQGYLDPASGKSRTLIPDFRLSVIRNK
jgi:hypothetical protein